MIKLLVFDVDGCLSDGKIVYSRYLGENYNGIIESKNFNVKDGFAIINMHKLGYKTAIITGRESSIVTHRAKELNITYCFQGVQDKLSILKDILSLEKISLSEVAMIGDDLNDIKTLKEVAISFTPNDGSKFVKASVDVVLNRDGGSGVVAEMIEYILAISEREAEYLNLY